MADLLSTWVDSTWYTDILTAFGSSDRILRKIKLCINLVGRYVIVGKLSVYAHLFPSGGLARYCADEGGLPVISVHNNP